MINDDRPMMLRVRGWLILVCVEKDNQLTWRGAVEQRYQTWVGPIGRCVNTYTTQPIDSLYDGTVPIFAACLVLFLKIWHNFDKDFKQTVCNYHNSKLFSRVYLLPFTFLCSALVRWLGRVLLSFPWDLKTPLVNTTQVHETFFFWEDLL